MAYREPAPRGEAVSRRLASDDSFRWSKLALGAGLLGVSLFFVWSATYNSLECAREVCVLRQDHLLRPTEQFSFDARHPPAQVVVAPATVGKNGRGKKLVLRYPQGDIELARDWGEGVEANATRLRAHFADPRGNFSLGQSHEHFFAGFMLFVALLGLLVLLDGLTLAGWRRVGADGDRRILTIDRFIFGLRVTRETFAITPTTSLGREQMSPTNPHYYWLTLEQPGAKPTRLPLLDRPKARAVVEALLARNA